MGAAADLSEPQAFRNVALQMMIDQTFTFCRIFHKKLLHIQVFDSRYEWLKWKRYPFTRFQLLLPRKFPASSFRSNISGFNDLFEVMWKS